MYADNVLQNLALTAGEGKLQTCQTVLSASITGTVLNYKSLTLPDWAKGFRIYPNADIRFAINEMPLFTTATFVVGGHATACLWTTKYLDFAIGRTLQMVTLATATVTVEVF